MTPFIWMFHGKVPGPLEWSRLAQTGMTWEWGSSRGFGEIVLHSAICVYTVLRVLWQCCSVAAAGCSQRHRRVSCCPRVLSVQVKKTWQKVVCSDIHGQAPGPGWMTCHRSPRLRFRWRRGTVACELSLHQLNCSYADGLALGWLLYPARKGEWVD